VSLATALSVGAIYTLFQPYLNTMMHYWLIK
ncbi:MAG: metal-dependent hydrolase, partial [Staphylococcus epidermidis]|nr:metal-dependent hydrolase [Staphylococcus epidermidis]